MCARSLYAFLKGFQVIFLVYLYAGTHLALANSSASTLNPHNTAQLCVWARANIPWEISGHSALMLWDPQTKEQPFRILEFNVQGMGDDSGLGLRSNEALSQDFESARNYLQKKLRHEEKGKRTPPFDPQMIDFEIVRRYSQASLSQLPSSKQKALFQYFRNIMYFDMQKNTTKAYFALRCQPLSNSPYYRTGLSVLELAHENNRKFSHLRANCAYFVRKIWKEVFPSSSLQSASARPILSKSPGFLHAELLRKRAQDPYAPTFTQFNFGWIEDTLKHLRENNSKNKN